MHTGSHDEVRKRDGDKKLDEDNQRTSLVIQGRESRERSASEAVSRLGMNLRVACLFSILSIACGFTCGPYAVSLICCCNFDGHYCSTHLPVAHVSLAVLIMLQTTSLKRKDQAVVCLEYASSGSQGTSYTKFNPKVDVLSQFDLNGMILRTSRRPCSLIAVGNT